MDLSAFTSPSKEPPATSCATLGSQVGAISRLRRPGDHRWPEAPRWYIAHHGLVSRPTSDEAPDDACRLLRKPCWTAYRCRNQLALLGFEASDRPGLQLCRFYINQPAVRRGSPLHLTLKKRQTPLLNRQFPSI